jgi:hypothetical protein
MTDTMCSSDWFCCARVSASLSALNAGAEPSFACRILANMSMTPKRYSDVPETLRIGIAARSAAGAGPDCGSK